MASEIAAIIVVGMVAAGVFLLGGFFIGILSEKRRKNP